MTDDPTTLRAFFGEGEQAFRLTPETIREHEAKTNAGIGALFARVLGRGFTLDDVLQTIRLALIGAGTAPQEAHRLVDSYAANRPLSEGYALAVAILATLFGEADEPAPTNGEGDQ